jgi:hypothetical protein
MRLTLWPDEFEPRGSSSKGVMISDGDLHLGFPVISKEKKRFRIRVSGEE